MYSVCWRMLARTRRRPVLLLICLALLLPAPPLFLGAYSLVRQRCALRHTLVGHTDLVASLATSPDGRLLASGSEDTTVRVWGVPGGNALAVLDCFSDVVRDTAFSPDGTLLACASDGDEIAALSGGKVS